MTINTIDKSQRNLLVGILILKVRVAHHVIVTKRVRGTLYGSMNPMNTACAAIFLVLGFFPAYCQNSPAPEFEVASVKLASHPSSAYEEGFRKGRASQGIIVQGNRVTITDHSLKDLVRLAYRVKPYQVTGEKWMETEKYEVAAILPAGASASDGPEMLRTLLAGRFHLTVRRESNELAVYALLLGKGGPKMKAAVTGGPAQAPPNTKQMVQAEQSAGMGMVAGDGVRHVRGKEYTIGALADRLTGMLDRPMLDLTGLDGKYDIDLTFAPGDGSDLAPSLFAALRDQLGLRVEARKSPMTIIVIEHADKTPMEN